MRIVLDEPAFRHKVLNNICGVYALGEKRAVVYYHKEGKFYASAHERRLPVAHYEHTPPSQVWVVSHQEIVDSIDELWQIYQHEIQSEWLLTQ